MARHRVQPARNWGASATAEGNGGAGTALVPSSPPREAEGAPPVRLVSGRGATVSRVMRVISSERLGPNPQGGWRCRDRGPGQARGRRQRDGRHRRANRQSPESEH